MADIPNNQNSQYLSSEQYEKVIIDVIRSFDTEVSRINSEEKQKRVLELFLGLYHDQDLFTFFTLRTIQNLTEIFFTNEMNRSFILNTVERSVMNWCVTEIRYDDSFVNSLVKGISYNKAPYSESRNVLINQEVQETIQVTPDVLKSLLIENIWLAILYILIVNFNRSNIYIALQQRVKPN